jgi:hypothetical protein
MALSYSKPSKRPDWGDTSTNITEPPAAFKDAGWLFDAVHPSSYENWKAHNISDWFKWTDERWADGATNDDLSLNASLSIDASSHSLANAPWGLNVLGKGTGPGIRCFAGGASIIADISTGNGIVSVSSGIAVASPPSDHGIVALGKTGGVWGQGVDVSGVGGYGGGFRGADAVTPGDGLNVEGGTSTTNDGGTGLAIAGGDGGTNKNGGYGIKSRGGDGNGTGFNGISISLGSQPLLFSSVHAGLGVYCEAEYKVGASGEGGTAGMFIGKAGLTSGLGGNGIVVTAGDGAAARGGSGVVVSGGNSAGSNAGGIGADCTGGTGGTNSAGGTGLLGTGGSGSGSGYNGAGLIAGSTISFSTVASSSSEGGAGVIGWGGLVSGSSGSGANGSFFVGGDADTTGIGGIGVVGFGGDGADDNGGSGIQGTGGTGGTNSNGGYGIIGIAGSGTGSGSDATGVIGLGTGGSFVLTSTVEGSGVLGVGGSSNGYGGVFVGANTRSSLRLEPQSAPTTGAIGDIYCDTSGILYICTNATGPVWTKVGTQT